MGERDDMRAPRSLGESAVGRVLGLVTVVGLWGCGSDCDGGESHACIAGPIVGSTGDGEESDAGVGAPTSGSGTGDADPVMTGSADGGSAASGRGDGVEDIHVPARDDGNDTGGRPPLDGGDVVDDGSTWGGEDTEGLDDGTPG